MMYLPKVVVLTGAGISVESGLATFRSSDGLWENHRVEDVATPEGFQRDPVLVNQFYNHYRHKLANEQVTPNLAHYALAKLEQRLQSNFLLVTQNIDDLHEKAGNQRLIHMHGDIFKVRCCQSGQIYSWRKDLSIHDQCECCHQSGMLRPHIVWFGEMPLEMDTIYNRLKQADYFLSIGTSGHVYPAAGFVSEANTHHAKTIELNLEPSQGQSFFTEKYYGPASEVVPQYIKHFLADLII